MMDESEGNLMGTWEDVRKVYPSRSRTTRTNTGIKIVRREGLVWSTRRSTTAAGPDNLLILQRWRQRAPTHSPVTTVHNSSQTRTLYFLICLRR